MPRVPMPEGPQATPGGIPQGRLVSPEASDFGARQLQGFGQALEGAGQVAGKIALDMQARADELRLTDAANKFKERQLTLQHDKDVGYLSVKGKNAFDRPDGKSLADHYDEQLAAAESDIAATLGTDRQKAAFQRAAGEMRLNFRGGVAQHESREYLGYQLSVAEGVQATAIRDIQLNWRNPDAVNAALTRIQSEVYRVARLTGKSAEWQDAQALKMTSNAHKVAALAALDQNDPSYAEDYLKRHAGQMEVDDTLAVRGHVTKAVDTQVGATVGGDAARQVMPRMAPSDFDRAFGVLLGAESGDRQFGADGKPLTSPAGAVGAAQVMPGTGPEAARLAGLPWDETRYRTDPDYNRALGKAYFGQQVKTFGGDLGKAFAAYNAGPGWVIKAADRAAKAQPGTPEAGWFWQLNNDGRTPANRQQTQDYVTKNLAAFGAGGGRPAQPTLADVHARVLADPRVAGNPARQKIALQEATRQFQVQQDAIKQRGDETYGQVLQGLIANGGDFKALPPALTAALATQNPARYDDALRFAEGLGKGQQPKTDWGVYYDLVRDPATLGSVNLLAVRDKLADTEFKQLVKMQQEAGSGGEKLTHLQGPMALVQKYAQEVGIDTNGKGKKDAERLGRITRRVQADVTEAEQAKGGKKLTPDEMRAVVGRAFVSVTVDSGRSWWPDAQKHAFELAPGDKVVSVKVPPDDRTRIEAALTKAGRPVTENNIQALYRRSAGIQ